MRFSVFQAGENLTEVILMGPLIPRNYLNVIQITECKIKVPVTSSIYL